MPCNALLRRCDEALACQHKSAVRNYTCCDRQINNALAALRTESESTRGAIVMLFLLYTRNIYIYIYIARARVRTPPLYIYVIYIRENIYTYAHLGSMRCERDQQQQYYK
ncbi:unnamed protein product [Trichogramma brassicae]|uniref:Uncharacterized protein n=1 Tax=Trichogramma brassicae TaxID=86971 RepID=A0A6H5HYP9_9HYME|nr:unnamed protein product [Trichogramma brassicae]